MSKRSEKINYIKQLDAQDPELCSDYLGGLIAEASLYMSASEQDKIREASGNIDNLLDLLFD